jgi:hypothetical protein
MALLRKTKRLVRFHPGSGLARIVATLACWLLAAANALPQIYQEHDVKAAFLYNFAKFITWPADKNDKGTLNVCIIGEDPFGGALDMMMRDKMVRGLRVAVARHRKTEDLAACHIVFVGQSDGAQFRQTLQFASRYNFLTVGETDGFVENGGMIGFIVKEGRVQFEVNLESTKRGNLQMSSKLLELAANVQGRK